MGTVRQPMGIMLRPRGIVLLPTGAMGRSIVSMLHSLATIHCRPAVQPQETVTL